MREPFLNSKDAEKWFLESLRIRGYEIKEIRDLRIRSGGGKIITQKLAVTTSSEVFQIAFWSKLYQLIDTADLREDFAKERDIKLKSVLRSFGYGNIDVLGIQMSAILQLIGLETEGLFAHLVFLVKDGRTFWCKARDFYNFVTRYDSFLIHAPTYGGEFCIVPIGWLLKWDDPIIAHPIIA